MAKFHINPKTGNAGQCKAVKDKCPFGDEDAHYDTLQEAVEANEVALAKAHGAIKAIKVSPGPQETYEEALKLNNTMRNLLKELPPETAKKVTGGYLDLTNEIEIDDAYKKQIDEFSKDVDSNYAALMDALNKSELKINPKNEATLAYLKEADASGNDGYKNEFMLAAGLSQYEGVEVYFPDSKNSTGGSPKVDLIVAFKGNLIPVSVKKNNGTQIEAHARRSTVQEIIPGDKVVSKIEEVSNRIFYYRPKFQARGMKPGQPEVLRTGRGGSPKWAGTSIRIEYGYKDKLPKDRPTLPDEVAIEAFGGIRQKGAIKFFNHKKEEVGELPSSAAQVLVADDFSKKDLKSFDSPKAIFEKSVPISRKGIAEAGVKVTLRVSSIGDREGDWITSRAHFTDEADVSLAGLKKSIESKSFN